MTLGPITDRYDFFTIADRPFEGRGNGRGLVTANGWGVSRSHTEGTPEDQAELKVYRIHSKGPDGIEYHEVSGFVGTSEECDRVAYEAGVLQYMIRKS